MSINVVGVNEWVSPTAASPPTDRSSEDSGSPAGTGAFRIVAREAGQVEQSIPVFASMDGAVAFADDFQTDGVTRDEVEYVPGCGHPSHSPAALRCMHPQANALGDAAAGIVWLQAFMLKNRSIEQRADGVRVRPNDPADRGDGLL